MIITAIPRFSVGFVGTASFLYHACGSCDIGVDFALHFPFIVAELVPHIGVDSPLIAA